MKVGKYLSELILTFTKLNITFVSTVPARPLYDAHFGGSFYFKGTMRAFNKPALSFNEQINQLINRGLIIENENKALSYLSNISYYRLSAYWYTFLEIPQTEHQFKPNSRLSQVIDTYVFDRKLRFLIFEEIERIEIALRTQIIYHYCHSHGSYWYENETLFSNRQYFDKFQILLQTEINRTNEVFIKHYKENYNLPENPPAWMVLELASFGQISTLYKNLKRTNDAKKKIAKHFGITEPVLESWLECLSLVRNICAHHMRLWNRKLPKKPTIPRNPQNTWIEFIPEESKQNRIYLNLVVIQYLLKSFIPNSNFSKRLKQLLSEYPDIPIQYMGFPVSWKEEEIWK